MTTGTVRTQGTELFVIDDITNSEPTRVKMACPTGINGLGGPRDQIEDTCLDTRDEKTFQAGLASPGQVSVPFNLVPRDMSHQNLFAWKADGRVMKWIACLSEGDDVPGIDSDGDFEIPADRTSIRFSAFVSDVNIDIANNEIVKGTLTLQRSGPVQFHPYVPAP